MTTDRNQITTAQLCEECAARLAPKNVMRKMRDSWGKCEMCGSALKTGIWKYTENWKSEMGRT